MITKFKIFEESSSSKYNADEIKDKLRKCFDTEKEFEEWCCKVDGVSKYNKVSFDGILSYDIPELLDLPVNDDELIDILSDILSDFDFDEYYEPRDGDIETWTTKKVSKKYNI